MTKQRVAVVFGGRSSEHAISVATAGGVLGAIDRERFDVVPVGITASGRFVLQPDDAERFQLVDGRLPELAPSDTTVIWPSGTEDHHLRAIAHDGTVTDLGEIDVVLPLLHGPFGEDGTIQGLLAMADLPYVGSGVLASAVGTDKEYTKIVLEAAGIDVGRYVTVRPDEFRVAPAEVHGRAAGLGLPLFVKPARAGSSVGVSKVTSDTELDAALEIAFAEDDKALIEAGVTGREIELGVLGSLHGAGTRVSAVAGEIVVSGEGFYDFEAKYLADSPARTVCPADVTDAELAELRRVAKAAFEALDCHGLCRVDVFLTSDGVVVNEVNTIPGFTPISMFPQLWHASGLDYGDLITDLIDQALEHEPLR